jgi:hypothetical protein
LIAADICRDEATKELKGYKGNDFVTDVSRLTTDRSSADEYRPYDTQKSSSPGTKTIPIEPR